MIDVSTETGGRVLLIKAADTVTKDEQEVLLQKLLDLMEETPGSIHALVDYSDVKDVEKGVVTSGLWFEMRYQPRVSRVAIVGDDRWENERIRTDDIFKMAEVRRFEPSDRDIGLEWVRG
ncbi:MAG: STAS/SEC14 domain-containing protein [Rhodospirillales bacterium]|nr:STAS/SEC14 domain-containing protein [Rhodospirillales bacterium]